MEAKPKRKSPNTPAKVASEALTLPGRTALGKEPRLDCLQIGADDLRRLAPAAASRPALAGSARAAVAPTRAVLLRISAGCFFHLTFAVFLHGRCCFFVFISASSRSCIEDSTPFNWANAGGVESLHLFCEMRQDAYWRTAGQVWSVAPRVPALLATRDFRRLTAGAVEASMNAASATIL